MESRFTLDQANELLPLLRSIATEIRERRAEQRELSRTRDGLEAARTPEGLDASLDDLEFRLRETRAGVRLAVGEIEALGGHVLRLTPLTVHIPGTTRRGDLVFCWQDGEERIGHGHPPGEEDDPRRPLRVRAEASGEGV